jgi:hypothetical protein
MAGGVGRANQMPGPAPIFSIGTEAECRTDSIIIQVGYPAWTSFAEEVALDAL